MKTPYAEEVNYWRTGQTSADTWMDNAAKEIRTAGGKLIGQAYGSEAATGRAAYMIEFEFSGERFRIVWPVLPTKTKNAASEKAARIQAATMLYHDVKARCVSAKVLGSRAAFFSYLMLPDGRTAAQAAAPEVSALFPLLLAGPEMG